MYEKKLMIVSILFLTFILGASFQYLISSHENETNISLNLRYGDLFPVDNIIFNRAYHNKDYSILFYLSPYCKACLDDLTYIDAMLYLFDDTMVNAGLLWELEITEGMINQYNLGQHLIGYYKDELQPSNTFPRYYILNDEDSLGSEPGQFNYPMGICYYDDKYYVIDSGNQRIQVLDKTFDYILEFPIDSFSLDHIGYTDIHADSSGIYLSTRMLVDKKAANVLHINNDYQKKILKKNSIGCFGAGDNGQMYYFGFGAIKEKKNNEYIYYKKIKAYNCSDETVCTSSKWNINTELICCAVSLFDDLLISLRPNGTSVDFYDPLLGYMYSYIVTNDSDIWNGETYVATRYDMCCDENNIYIINNLGSLLIVTPEGKHK